MSDALLLDLAPGAQALAGLDNLEEQADATFRLLGSQERELQRVMAFLIGSATLFEKQWREWALEVAQGHTAAVHALRPRADSTLRNLLGWLRRSHQLAGRFRKFLGEEAPDPDTLLNDIATLERLKTTVFDRWQTAEDLESLAVRDYPLTTADLDRIGPQRQPPTSWYAEENNPF